jgi:hypothetical protein
MLKGSGCLYVKINWDKYQGDIWMRILINRLLVTGLLFFFSAASASAVTLTLGGAGGQDVTPGGTTSVTLTLDTDATTGITLMSVGVLFDDTRLSYDQAASSTTSYILYGGKGGGGYMKASSTCGGYPQTAPAGCTIRVGTTNQVNVDYVSVDLTNGTQNTGSGILLVTLVFNVLANPGSAAISLTQTAPGNVVGQPGGASTTATLAGSGSVNVVPEPTTALLVGLGLAGLAVAGRRKA